MHDHRPSTVSFGDGGIRVSEPNGRMRNLPPGKYEHNIRHPDNSNK